MHTLNESRCSVTLHTPTGKNSCFWRGFFHVAAAGETVFAEKNLYLVEILILLKEREIFPLAGISG